MALDDFAPQGSTPVPLATATAKKAPSAEDEDLFDFPVIEMKFESDGDKKRPAEPAPAAAAAAQASVTSTDEAAPKPPAPAQAAPAAKAPTPVAKAAAPAPAPKSEAAPVKASTTISPKPALAPKDAQAKPAAGETRAKSKDKQDVAKAAQLVSDIEQVLVSDGKGRKRAPALGTPSLLTLAGIGALLLVNLGGLAFLWRSTQTFQSGVSAMNDQLVHALQVQALTQGQAAQTQAPQTGAHDPHASSGSNAPLEAFEETALGLAREEIQAGEYAAARRRLSRLLAAADRIEAEKRGEIEAQASFLLASTYRKQAEVAREKRP